MAKKRTGLQSEIAGIFSGVPVPKKGGQRAGSGGPPPKTDEPAFRAGGPVIPKPAVTQPTAHVAPIPQKPAEPIVAAPRLKVTEIKAPEQITRKIPRKIPRRRKDKIFVSQAGVSSSRQKAGIILFILFSAALVFVLARPYLMPHGYPAVLRSTETPNTGSSTKNNIKIDWPMPPVYSEDLRDPMIELNLQQQVIGGATDELMVRGITYSEDRRFAVIGINTVQEGDFVPGTKIKIKKINPNGVEFEEDDRTWTQEVESGKK
jgi:hypothetical protein